MTPSEQSNTRGSYSIRVRCSNCLHEDRRKIPCGQKIEDQACDVCGCKTIARAPFAMPGCRS